LTNNLEIRYLKNTNGKKLKIKGFNMNSKKIFIISILILLFSGCGLLKKTDVDHIYSQAEKAKFENAENAFNKKKYDEALNLYTEFVQEFPASYFVPQAYLKKGLITETENTDQALDIYMKIISDYPGSDVFFEASVHAANILIDTGRPAKALPVCDRALKKTDSENTKIRFLYIKANIYFALENYYEAAKLYNEIFKKDPIQYHRIRPLLSETASKMSKTELSGAFDLFLSNDASALFKKYYALALLKEDNTEEAKLILNEIIDNYPATETYDEAKTELEMIQKKGKVSIGVILPLSGQFAPYGDMALKAVQFAVSDFISKNPDIKIKLLIEDNQSLESGSKEAAEKLIKNKVSAIIGPFHTAEAACEYSEKNLVPIIAMTHKPSITKNKSYVFRHFITPPMQAEALINFAKEKLSITTFAILYPDESYGETFMNSFFDAAKQNNCKIMGVEKYNPESSDFSIPIRKLTGLYYEDLREVSGDQKKSVSSKENEELKPVIDFKAVFIPDGPAKAASLAPQLAYFDVFNPIFLGPNLWEDEKLIKASEGYIKEAYFTSLFFRNSSNEKVENFSRSYESLFGSKPGFIEALSYDSAMIIFNSVKKAGSASPRLIRDSIISTSVFDTVTGPTFFEISGECIKELIILKSDSKGIKEAKF
jgi:ABC-type branched-subunit amino acid transport system substrate-binding protein/predicted negative regulator of RcsB-dependent stress response